VPGPQFPLYLIGREMEELVPVPFLAPERALAVAMMSYNGKVDIGLMGDYDAIEDLDDFGGDIRESVDELRRVARPRRARKARAASPQTT
jgi:diacylglycerol O-acyltransferase